MSNEDKKRRTLVVRPFSQAVHVPGSGCREFNRSSKHTYGVHVSSYRRRFSLGGCSKVTEKSTVQTSRSTVRVFDEEGNDITPLQLYHFDQGILKAKTNMFFLNEISAGSVSGHTTATGSFIMPFSRSVLGSSRISSQSTIESVNEETQDTFSKCDIPITFQATQPYEKQKINIVKEQVTEDMLKEFVEIFITETDTILLLDMYPTFVSVEVDNAESLIERNHWYTGICKTRTKNAKYVDRSMQTLNFATKSKQLQSYNTVMVEAATTVSYCDIHHSSEQDGNTNRPEIDYAEAILDANKSAERSLSVGSTSTSVSTSNSLKEVDVFKNWINNELDFHFILLSEKFQHSLLVMERNVLWNIFQYQLAAYRQFSLLKEPDGFKHPQQVEQEHGDKEVCQSPALECLWIFSCELCRGYCISSMGWNKKNPVTDTRDQLIAKCTNDTFKKKMGLKYR